jgi:hypothetical protein
MGRERFLPGGFPIGAIGDALQHQRKILVAGMVWLGETGLNHEAARRIEPELAVERAADIIAMVCRPWRSSAAT